MKRTAIVLFFDSRESFEQIISSNMLNLDVRADDDVVLHIEGGSSRPVLVVEEGKDEEFEHLVEALGSPELTVLTESDFEEEEEG